MGTGRSDPSGTASSFTRPTNEVADRAFGVLLSRANRLLIRANLLGGRVLPRSGLIRSFPNLTVQLRKFGLIFYLGASSLGSDAHRGLKDHPTVKPTAMLEDALLDLTNHVWRFELFEDDGTDGLCAQEAGFHGGRGERAISTCLQTLPLVKNYVWRTSAFRLKIGAS